MFVKGSGPCPNSCLSALDVCVLMSLQFWLFVTVRTLSAQFRLRPSLLNSQVKCRFLFCQQAAIRPLQLLSSHHLPGLTPMLLHWSSKWRDSCCRWIGARLCFFSVSSLAWSPPFLCGYQGRNAAAGSYQSPLSLQVKMCGRALRHQKC